MAYTIIHESKKSKKLKSLTCTKYWHSLYTGSFMAQTRFG